MFDMFVCFISQGNLEDAYSLYEQAIAIEKGKEHSQALPMLFAQYSRFAYFVWWTTWVDIYLFSLSACLANLLISVNSLCKYCTHT